ncbi:MAG: ABC transporter permease [Bacteroidota bacterium]
MHKNHHPPHWIDRFLEGFCTPQLLEEVQGDLHELYREWIKEYGKRRANWLYLLHTIKFLRPFAIRKYRFSSLLPLAMLKNYLTIIYRNFQRQPFQNGLNLFCLALSITATLLMLLYINFELTYDQFHQKANRIYRVETQGIQTHDQLREVDWPTTPANLATFLKQDYSDIEATVRFYQFWQGEEVEFHYQDDIFREAEIFVADASVFDVFSFTLTQGDAREALTGPNKIILSETLARQIFGGQNPVGKLLKSDLAHIFPDTPEGYSLMVTGVYRDLPENTHLPAHALISSETDPHLDDYYFNRFSAFTYVLLPNDTDPMSLAPRLSQIYTSYLNPEREPVMVSAQHALTPLTDIHLKESGGFTYVYIYGVVSLLLLFLAVISYVNLLTAQASNRAREIGVRQIMGSRRGQLIYQFLTESTLFTFAALLVGIILLVVSIDSLNSLLGLQLNARALLNPFLLLGMLGILVVLGLLGGSYPAFFLSSFRPVSVMKTQPKQGKSLRGVLLSVQFGVVLFVLSCTLMVYNQLQFLRQKDLGFSQEHIVMLALSGQEEIEKSEVLKETLLQSPQIASVGAADFVPGAYGMVNGPITADGAPEVAPQFIRRGRIDPDFLTTMNIGLVAGRDFTDDRAVDQTQSVLVNQAFVHLFNLDQPIGDRVRFGDKGNPNFLEIIGVVEDFQQGSLHAALEPQLFRMGATNRMAVKLTGNLAEGLKQVEKSWVSVLPNSTFDYSFLDETLQDLYTADQIRGKVFLLLSLVTLFISFAGLYGLAAFLTRQRIKEVGIRKVLGAGLGNIVVLMTRRFLLLVTMAALPAFWLAEYIMQQWLENFAYRTNLSYDTLGLLLLATLLLTFLTTGWHASRAALANPVESLRNE